MGSFVLSFVVLFLCQGLGITLRQIPVGKTNVFNPSAFVEIQEGGTGIGATCPGFEVVRAFKKSDFQRILVGVLDWIESAVSGSWGAYMQSEWKPLKACFDELAQPKCGANPDCKLPAVLTVMTCASRKRKAVSLPVRAAFAQNTEANKLFKRMVLIDFYRVLGGVTDFVPTVEGLVASFSSDGKLQGLGQITLMNDGQFNNRDIHSAITLYALSYAKKNQVRAMKGAGKALVGGWLGQVQYSGQMMLKTQPASAYVRKYYMTMGAATMCGQQHKQNSSECTSMLRERRPQNCDCDVQLCIQPQCRSYYSRFICGEFSGGMLLKAFRDNCFNLRTRKFNVECK